MAWSVAFDQAKQLWGLGGRGWLTINGARPPSIERERESANNDNDKQSEPADTVSAVMILRLGHIGHPLEVDHFRPLQFGNA